MNEAKKQCENCLYNNTLEYPNMRLCGITGVRIASGSQCSCGKFKLVKSAAGHQLIEHLKASTSLMSNLITNCRMCEECEPCIQFPCLLIKQAERNRELIDSIENS